ncbi:MAG: NAD(P)H-hydrate dehydratase [Dethiobacter sp.]|jgi:NAD(P)H-hydrate epimerase|nr:NAD(P)H-hydrate dehydratase [Dethiobacter sp.]
MDIVTANQMREIDRRAIAEFAIPGIILMENAGLRVVEAARDLAPKQKVIILAGPGNNGGDGLVAARHLSKKTKVSVWLAALPQDYRGDALSNLTMLQRLGHPFRLLADDGGIAALEGELEGAGLVIDAMLGTGTSRAVSGVLAAAISAVNRCGRPVLSVDIPSGICADSGRVLGEAVRASFTVTFGLPKRGLLLFPGADHTGRLEVVDIGLPPQLLTGHGFELLTEAAVCGLLRSREPDSHKGTFGTVLLVAGSPGMTGAAVLAARAALRGGAGLVTAACPRCVQPVIAAMVAEATTLPLPDNNHGRLRADALFLLREKWQSSNVVAVGPGLSTDANIMPLLAGILSECGLPVVLDADALTALARHPKLAESREADTVITPHPGEAARLLGCSVAEVQSDRPGAALSLAKRYRAVAVLKGAHTLVAAPDGSLALNTTGNSGMATGGSGDVLTGLLAALLAQGLAPFDAARAAVYLHGVAGDQAAAAIGQDALIAGDLLDWIPHAWLKIRNRE